ncbi:hypothetical protein KAJ27_15910 [bacterium]|nr:hypothetical protein [bacterium]
MKRNFNILIQLVLIFMLVTPAFSKITGPGRISEDKEGTWKANMVPKLLPGARAEILKYMWRFYGPGGGELTTKVPTAKWTYDTPADPVPNLITCHMYYNVYVMQPGPPPYEVGPILRRVKNAFKVKILDKTPPGWDASGTPEEPATVVMKTGEGPREDLFAIVMDNNPQFPGPHPELRKVSLYYQVGKYEYFRNFSEDNPDEITGWAHQVGPYFCNYPYSDITGDDEYQYPFTPEESAEQQAVNVFSKTAPYEDDPNVSNGAVPDDGWPDAGFRWVGPIDMELSGPPIKIGEKFHTLKYTLSREQVIAPLRYSKSSKDWQVLKAFITATDSSGNKMTCTYKDSLAASCGGNLFVMNFEVEDNDPPWLEVRVFSSREDKETIIGMYPKTKFMYANMDEEWTWEDDYFMDPSEDGGKDLRRCFYSDKTLHEDVRYAFHFAANDNCNFSEDIFKAPSGQDGGINLDTIYFKIVRIMPGTGEENLLKEIKGENDRKLGFIFTNPGEYIFEFYAEDLAGNGRLLKSKVNVGDTYITEETLEKFKQSQAGNE